MTEQNANGLPGAEDRHTVGPTRVSASARQLTQTKFIRCYEKRAAPIESTKGLAITDTKGLEHEASEPGCDRGFRDWRVAPTGTAVFQQRAPRKRDQEATYVASIIIQGR